MQDYKDSGIQGVRGSSDTPQNRRIKMLKNYAPTGSMETRISLSKDLVNIEADQSKMLQAGIGKVERIFKALIKSLE